ncbi:hypothetical protein PPYR_12904 [Photinus pyralis]|uniref:FLYWCH-type domain-containing protein n=1 Tax=Photinus pyralis TaxID=7054 RepID=A0A5N4A7H6_PHOPY|nr:hypothetical protein PPYR_12904 [Photinus pyralis]
MENEILSQRSQAKFCSEGFVYVFDRMSSDGNVKFWRCQERGRCKARLHSGEDGVVLKTINQHSHEASAAKVEVQKIITRIKRRVADTIEPTIQMHLKQLKVHFLNPKRLKRQKEKIGNPCGSPKSYKFGAISYPRSLFGIRSSTRVFENFLLADSGPGLNRILIFGRRQNLDVLHHSREWFADGTFKIAPLLFSQIYTVLATAHQGVHPIFYALLPNKQEVTYRRMFELVIELQPELNPDQGVHPIFYALLPNKQEVTYRRMFELVIELQPELNPESIACDFENAAISAMKHCFPRAEIRGCFFHLVQNMHKKLSHLGLMQRYRIEADFALAAKMVTALPFVPHQHLDEAIDMLANELPPELQPLLEWFEDTYVGRLNRRGNGRPPGMFPPQMWNMYERVLHDQNRTNNHAEAAHRRLQVELGVEHPTLWKLIESLRKVQKGRDLYYEQLVAGHAPPLKLRKYRDADSRILRIVRNYNTYNNIEFLRAIAHNYVGRGLPINILYICHRTLSNVTVEIVGSSIRI